MSDKSENKACICVNLHFLLCVDGQLERNWSNSRALPDNVWLINYYDATDPNVQKLIKQDLLERFSKKGIVPQYSSENDIHLSVKKVTPVTHYEIDLEV